MNWLAARLCRFLSPFHHESGPLVRLRSEAEKGPLSRPYGTFYVVSNEGAERPAGAAPHSSGQRPRGACRRHVGFVPSPISSPKKLMFLLFCAHLFATLAPPKLLSLTSSSNVTTRPIKRVYWHSLLHLFGNETKKLWFLLCISLTYS